MFHHVTILINEISLDFVLSSGGLIAPVPSSYETPLPNLQLKCPDKSLRFYVILWEEISCLCTVFQGHILHCTFGLEASIPFSWTVLTSMFRL